MIHDTLYFDCGGGAAGDMILASLLHMNLPKDHLDEAIAKLGIPGVRVEVEPVMKHHVASYRVTVRHNEQHHHRHLKHIVEMIEASSLDAAVKENSIHVFRILAEAEAKIHAKTPESVHFHEVGAIDSIVDIVGAAALIDILQPGKIVVSPLPFGHGTIATQHGPMPNPAPATTEILKGIPTYGVDVAGELVTPTAAAIFKHYAHEFSRTLGGTISQTGYGAGTKDYAGSSGMLRAMLVRGNVARDTEARVIECTIDDMTAEELAYVQNALMEAGADDAWITPIVMKKGRAGHTLSLLTERDDYHPFIDILFRETTTWGVRIGVVLKEKLVRREEVIATRFGNVPIKIGALPTGDEKMKPEYEPCQAIAKEQDVPLKDVLDEVKHAYRLSSKTEQEEM